MARSYDISLLPSLQEQLVFFKNQSHELLTFCETEYGKFLAAVDEKSSMTDDQAMIDNLEEIYEFAADRLEALKSMMLDELEAIELWQKNLIRVAETGNTSLWADVASEMLEDADFKTNTTEFKEWAIDEMANLKSNVVDVLSDWLAAIQEGNTAELAKFIEALDEMEEEDADFEDRCCDDADCDDECDDDECSSDECDDEDGCCGRQSPCCRNMDSDDEDA